MEKKKELSKNISSEFIDNIYSRALKNGALGGKILGAGGGGFFLFYAPINKHIKIKKALKKFPIFNFKFDTGGTRIIFYDERYK